MSGRAGAYDPCIDNEVTAYFNRPDVQQAFHANSSGNELPYAWESCSSQILYSRCTHVSHISRIHISMH